jgi:hypothetical protein
MKIARKTEGKAWREVKGQRGRRFGYVHVSIDERGEYFAVREWKEPEFSESKGAIKIRDPNQKPVLALLRSPEVLAMLGPVTCGTPVRLVFDRYAGCASCPCSPGFRPVDADGRRGWLTEKDLDLDLEMDDSYDGPTSGEQHAARMAAEKAREPDMVAHLESFERRV